MKAHVRWCLAKDDVTPQDIFRMTNGTARDRSIIAKYCIQDCNIVQSLLKKNDVITGYTEMARLCSVPLSFVILRGQGIKLTSFISKKCREKGTLMPVIMKIEDDVGYEGAIVLEPKCDLYMDDPIACVDYSSLYPSSMISENLCHSSKVWTKEYNTEHVLVSAIGEKQDGSYRYDNLEGFTYVDITYDIYQPNTSEKVVIGYKTCRFAESLVSKAIMPSVLEELLATRKSIKQQMSKESNPFIKNIYDKRQNSIKITANSLYGQCGARTSSFYEKDVAAATTATGRKLLTYAKRVIEESYENVTCYCKSYGNVKINAEYIYGDTDSVFFRFNPRDPESGKKIIGKQALEITIELAQQAGKLATKFLKKPHDLVYEKTFLPFCLLSKKRYVGMLYEYDSLKCKRKSMGIVLKRRDNAPIVKDVYGGIIDILMNEQDISKAMLFLDNCLQKIIQEDYPIDKLIITKSLRSGYKNPQQIAHKVLADRMTMRDPGNKPAPGDRIPYAFIVAENNTKRKLQCDKIEHPDFIKLHRLKLDYSHYITNQIMKPVLQIFALVINRILTIKHKPQLKNRIEREIAIIKKTFPEAKHSSKIEIVRNKEVRRQLFDKYINECENKNNNNSTMYQFFTPLQKK
jgi:DNA polymerase delta subunit 1